MTHVALVGGAATVTWTRRCGWNCRDMAPFGIVDSPNAMVLAVTLLAWQSEADTATRLLGAIEVRIAAATWSADGVRDSEPVSGTLPGDLSVAPGRLPRRLVAVSNGLPRAGPRSRP